MKKKWLLLFSLMLITVFTLVACVTIATEAPVVRKEQADAEVVEEPPVDEPEPIDEAVETELEKEVLVTEPPEEPATTELVEEVIVTQLVEEPAATELLEDLILNFEVLGGTAWVNGSEASAGEIIVGDILSTDIDGYVELSLPGDDRVFFDVKPNTIVIIETLNSSSIRLFLEVGTIRSSVRDNAGIHVVIAAEAGESEAGGTIWISEVDTTGALLVAVLEGRVVARTQGGYEVEMYDEERLDITADGDIGSFGSTTFIYFHSSLSNNDTGWDVSQPPTLTGRYSRLADALFEAGYIIEDSINPEPFSYYDVLITIDSSYGLTEENIRSIQDWVKNGKGMFVIRDWVSASFNDQSNSLLGPFGIRLNGRDQEVYDFSVAPFIINYHPITLGVESLPLYGYCQLDLDTDYAIPLAGDPLTEFIVLAATKNENDGRVLVLCDTDSLANIAWDEYPESQTTFILNAVNWLAGK